MKQILVIDDDVNLTEVIKTALSFYAYNVTVFHNAEDALSYARTKVPDAMIIDIVLPGTSGAEMVGLLKKNAVFSKVPVLFLTGLLDYEDQQEGLVIDGKTYPVMAKPFKIPELATAIERLVT